MLISTSNEVEQTRSKVFVTCKTLAEMLKLCSYKIENGSRKTILTGRMIWRQADGMMFVSLFTSKQAIRTTITGLLIEFKNRLTKLLMISRIKQAVNSIIFR